MTKLATKTAKYGNKFEPNNHQITVWGRLEAKANSYISRERKKGKNDRNVK
jgi:hypothetical protein